MTLRPGYNIVTEPIDSTDTELGALEFFRKAANNDPLPNRVTVTGLEDLLFHAEPDERPSIVSELMMILRNTDSVTHMTAVQFVIDGQLSPSDRFQIRIERQGEAEILDIGEIFVDEPELITPDHAVATK